MFNVQPMLGKWEARRSLWRFHMHEERLRLRFLFPTSFKYVLEKKMSRLDFKSGGEFTITPSNLF